MFELYLKCRSSYEVREISKNESWCNDLEAFVVTNSNDDYYRRYWKIDRFEV